MESKSKTLLQDRTLDKYPVAIRQHLCIAWVGENDQRDCRKITDQFRGIYRIYSTLIKENRRMSTCNRLDLQNIRISTDRLCPRIFPITGGLLMVCYCVPVSRRVLLTGRCSLWWGHSSLLFLSCCGFNGLLIFFLHFQVNMGNSPAQAFAAFSSSGPGRVSLPQTLFASHIPDDILRLSFNVPQDIISALEASHSHLRKLPHTRGAGQPP